MSSDTHLGISTQQARHTRELQVPCSPYTVIMRHSGVDTTPTLWDTGQTQSLVPRLLSAIYGKESLVNRVY